MFKKFWRSISFLLLNWRLFKRWTRRIQTDDCYFVNFLVNNCFTIISNNTFIFNKNCSFSWVFYFSSWGSDFLVSNRLIWKQKDGGKINQKPFIAKPYSTPRAIKGWPSIRIELCESFAHKSLIKKWMCIRIFIKTCVFLKFLRVLSFISINRLHSFS